MGSSRKKSGRKKSTDEQPLVVKALYFVICGSVLLIALTISVEGRDPFRLPKDIVFRAEFIVVAALVLVGLLLKQIPLRALNWKEPIVLMPLAIVAWTLLTTIASSNPALSWPAFWYVAGASLVFVTTAMVARGRELKMLSWLLWGAILNAGMFLLQSFRIWNPLPFVPANFASYDPDVVRFASTGFVGNANDLGSALLPVFVVSLAAAAAARRRRFFYVLAFTLIAAATLRGVALAAIGGMLVATVTIAPLLNLKRALQVGAAILLISAVVLPNVPDVREGVARIASAIEEGQWDEATRGRLISFATAKEMIIDNPILGTGPGTFGWQYYPYKLAAVDKHPSLISVMESQGNFEEAHNDHLEVMSETGAPGYAVLLAALVVLVYVGFRRRPEAADTLTEEQNLSRLTMLPLVLSFATLALAQYPLQLTSSVAPLIFIAAICSAPKLGGQSESASDFRRLHFRDAPYSIQALVVLALLIAPLLVYYWCARPWTCNVFSKRLEAALHVSRTGNEQAKVFLFRSLATAEECRDCLPQDANLHLVVATTYGQTGRHEAEIETYDEALRYDRRPELYFNRAVAKLRSGNEQAALDDYVYSARFAPLITKQITDQRLRQWVDARVRELGEQEPTQPDNTVHPKQ